MRLCKISFILSVLEKYLRQQEGKKSKSRNTNYKALVEIQEKDMVACLLLF